MPVISLRHRRTAWLIALLMVVCVALVSFASTRRYVTSQAAVQHTLAVRAAIADTLSLLKDAETGQRGYLLTGDQEFLTPYQTAQRELIAQLARLHELTRDDDVQAASAAEVQTLGTEKLFELARTIELRHQGQVDAALSIVREGTGNRVMERLRAETERMLTREAARLEERESVAARGERRALGALAAAFGLVLAIVIAGLTTARRDLAEVRLANSQLLDSEQTLRSLADSAVDLIWILDDEARPTYASPSSLALLGYTPQQMLALQPLSWLHPDDAARAGDRMQSFRSHGIPSKPFVHRLRHQDGTYRWFETRLSAAQDQARKSGHLHLASRDVTARKLAEDALQRQTARLESILSNMGDGVVVLDAERRLLVVNPAARQYIRQAEGEQVPVDWSKHHRTYLPDGVTLFPPEWGPLTRALRGDACHGVELVIYDPENRPHALSVTAHPIRDGERSAGCVAVYRDVTEQRRAEQELSENEQRFRVLSDATFEGVAITKSGKVVDTNDNLAAWLGWDRSELVGRDGLSLFAPEDREHVARSSLREPLYEARMLRQDGTQFPVEVRGRQASLHAESVRIAVVRDITQRKQREDEAAQQAELLRALSLRDELTSLYNRRGFIEHAQQLLRNAARQRRAACLFFADLDGLKRINDELGHDAGDRALTSAATLLVTVFRDSDIVARLGGDEFAMLALDCDNDHVANVRARLQAAVVAFNAPETEPFRISISLGTAVYDSGQPIELEQLIELADARMYEEKRRRGPCRSVSRRALGS